MNHKVLYDVIFDKIEKEDEDLNSLIGKGIFYAPELYVAFILGKEIKRNELEIFGKQTNWVREINFGNGGPTDFAFTTDESTYAFELKLRDTHQSYSDDLNKLKKLNDGYVKFFVALVDSWETKKDLDERILTIEKNYKNELTRVSKFKSFPTVQNRYKEQIFCTLALWKL